MTRMSTSTDWVSPTRRTWRRSSTRSSCGCRSSASSPISSRNSVPPFAASIRPCLSVAAPVKRRLRVAEQLATRSARAGSSRSRRRRTARFARRLVWWIASAIASLPVPVSPCSRIVASVGAALREQREQPLHRLRRAEHVAEAIARSTRRARRWRRSARRRSRCACRGAAAPRRSARPGRSSRRRAWCRSWCRDRGPRCRRGGRGSRGGSATPSRRSARGRCRRGCRPSWCPRRARAPCPASGPTTTRKPEAALDAARRSRRRSGAGCGPSST